MRHPYKKFAQLQLFMIVVTVFVGVLALAYQHLFLALLTCIFLALSFLFEALVELKRGRTYLFGQQLLRAIIIIIFVSFIYFK
ncbi:hypothetical protein [Aquibacillus salsiterrae]|uniref:Uncharacterized protein n=1 Tax=Aquibacillus salsiterrae TaxID=2950439 RepID=A0A9X4AEP2_9BACI|nr:hypothetical protein [Aquibacillus salsiterrae]MDC3416814.1 hypothetical protein [Aquibacillus salsiterrae]